MEKIMAKEEKRKNLKEKLFDRVLTFEHLAEANVDTGRNYDDMAESAFEMLEIMGLGREYIRWSCNK